MTPQTNIVPQPFEHALYWAAQRPAGHLFNDDQQALEYGEAVNYAAQIAATFRQLGVQQGDSIALELPVGLHTLFLLAAFHEATVTLVHREDLHTQGFIADWLFSTSRTRSESARNTVLVDNTFLQRLGQQSTQSSPKQYESPESLCRIAFSSGSTGTPKLIPLTLEMVHHRSRAARKLWLRDSPFLCLLDIATASGFHTLYAALMNGDTYFCPGLPAHNAMQIAHHGITAIKASPIQIANLLDEATRQNLSLSSLTTIYVAGSVLPVALRKRIRSLIRAKMFSLYGSTEAGRAAEREITDDDLAYVGNVVAGTQLEVVDDQHRPLPYGELGAVRYKRQHQATEYLCDEHTTRETFRDGWFYTGDLGSLTADGQLTLAGRNSDIINAGGVKVNPFDVETFALTLDGVLDAAGFSYTNESGLTQFGLALVKTPDLDLNSVIDRLRNAFGSLAPSTLFSVPGLPRNSAGKITRAAVRKLYEQAISRSRQQ